MDCFMKIKELGHINSKREELREYCKLKIDHVIRLLPRRILSNDGGDVLDCVLNGLSDSPCKNKIKIADIILQTMRSESTSLTHCGDVISRLCLELPKLPATDLVRWCNDSVQSIVDDSDINMIWRDVLPECLNALSAHTVKHSGTDMTGAEFKQQCVHMLCLSRWKEPHLVQLAAMFKDMQLLRSDHKQVVNKLCSYIIDIPPDTLPPLVHQLLKLCKSYHVEIVLSHLSHYFSVRLYSKLEPPPQDSESTTLDIDDIVPHSPAELSRCLSTCIYHITQGAAEPELIRKHIKTWPKTQLLRAPFLLDLALAVSDKGADFRSLCLDVIKSAIEQRVTDKLRSQESAWARSVLPPDIDVASVLKVLTTESANHRQLTVIGLINLAFALLGVPRSRPAAQACWSHGKLVLVRLSKAQPETAAHILGHLADRLAADCTHRQYADCLHVLCALSPVSLERCSQLSVILESCQPLSADYRSAAAVLDAVHPLLNFSARVRDTLVMVCRKGLYSRDSAHRCLALWGFLSVLRYARLSRGISSSQGACSEQHSAHSYLTQLVDLHATYQGAPVTSRVRNEAMCMEVVSILRRVLVQDAAVKQLLYTKIYECAVEKPVLHEPILELLSDHLAKYLPEAGADGDPLMFDKCVHMTSVSAILVEPISRLLYAAAQFLQPSDEEEDLEDILSSQAPDTGSAYLKSKLTNILDQLINCPRFGNVDLENPGLIDLTPESKAKTLKVQQILQCYEALIAHQIMQWNTTSDDPATKIYNLFKKCNDLLEKTKSQQKVGKKSSKTTLNDTRETVKTQKSQKSQKEKEKGPLKVSNLIKDRAGPFKPLPCVWDLKLCLRVLELLYNENVSWGTSQQRNSLRTKRDIHQWSVRCVQSALSECSDKRAAKTVAGIAGLLYRRCICRLQDMSNFDMLTTLLCTELFKDCLAFLLSPDYSLKLDSFLPTITGLADASLSSHIATMLEQLHSSLVAMETESGEHDKRLISAVVAVTVLVLEIPTPDSAETSAVIVKLEDYVRTSRQECLPLIPALLAASCREMQEAQLLDDLLLKLTGALGRIDEDDTSAGEEPTTFPSIDARTGHNVLTHICAHLSARHKTIEHLLLRARDLTAALDTAVHGHAARIDKEVKELYKSIVIQLCQVSTWTYRMSKLRCSVGVGSERVLACAVRLYALQGALARALQPETARLLRLERLLKLSGKKLSSAMDNLITYVEASQRQPSARGVLRDTKLIPRLVLEAEMFTKHVILLDNKGQLNYQQYLSLGTARDFRIKGPALQEALQAVPQRDDVEQSAMEEVEEILSPAIDGADEPASDEEQTSPKRRRV